MFLPDFLCGASTLRWVSWVRMGSRFSRLAYFFTIYAGRYAFLGGIGLMYITESFAFVENFPLSLIIELFIIF